MGKKYRILPLIIKEELADKGISVRQLGNPNSDFCIGISATTINRALKTGIATEETVVALQEVLDDDFIVERIDIQEESEKLREENAALKEELRQLRLSINFSMSERIRYVDC